MSQGNKRQRTDEEESLCVVCSEEPMQMLQIECDHRVLCATCVIRILEEGRSCPVCRTYMLLPPVLKKPAFPLSVDTVNRAMTRAQGLPPGENTSGVLQALMAIVAKCDPECFPVWYKSLKRACAMEIDGKTPLWFLHEAVRINFDNAALFAFLDTAEVPTGTDSDSGSESSEEEDPDSSDSEDDDTGLIHRINCYLRAAWNDPSLTELDVNTFPSLGVQGTISIAKVLAANTSLKAIRFENVALVDTAVETLARTLQSHPTIERITFESNEFEPGGFEALMTALRSNRAIKFLSLRANVIGGAGAIAALAALVHGNTTIEEIEIDGCNLGPVGSAALAEALGSNQALTKLTVSRSFIGQSGIDSLSEAFSASATLRILNLVC